MKSAFCVGVGLLIACNQSDGPPKPSAAPPSVASSAPALAPRAVAPPDAETYVVEVAPPVDAAPSPPPDAAHGKHAHGGDPNGISAQEAELERQAAAFANALTSDKVADTPTNADGPRRPGADLAAQINDVRDADNRTAFVGGARGGASISTGHPAPPAGSVSIESPSTSDDTTLEPDLVRKKIMSLYRPALLRCYKNLLAANPTWAGKVAVTFTVNETGRVTEVVAHGVDAGLDTCVHDVMSTWHFPPPKDADGEATDSHYAITFVFAP